MIPKRSARLAVKAEEKKRKEAEKAAIEEQMLEGPEKRRRIANTVDNEQVMKLNTGPPFDVKLEVMDGIDVGIGEKHELLDVKLEVMDGIDVEIGEKHELLDVKLENMDEIDRTFEKPIKVEPTHELYAEVNEYENRRDYIQKTGIVDLRELDQMDDPEIFLLAEVRIDEHGRRILLRPPIGNETDIEIPLAQNAIDVIDQDVVEIPQVPKAVPSTQQQIEDRYVIGPTAHMSEEQIEEQQNTTFGVLLESELYSRINEFVQPLTASNDRLNYITHSDPFIIVMSHATNCFVQIIGWLTEKNLAKEFGAPDRLPIIRDDQNNPNIQEYEKNFKAYKGNLQQQDRGHGESARDQCGSAFQRAVARLFSNIRPEHWWFNRNVNALVEQLGRILTTLPGVIGVIPITGSILGDYTAELPRLNGSDIRIANRFYKIYLMIMADSSVKSYSFLFNNNERLHPNEIFAKLCTIGDIEKELNSPILNEDFRASGRLHETMVIDLLDRLLLQDVLTDQRNKKLERFANIVYSENKWCSGCDASKTGYFHRPSEGDDTTTEQCLKHHLRSTEDKFKGDPSFQEALMDLKRTIVTNQRLLLKDIKCAAPLDGYCHADCVGGKFLDKSEGIAVCSKHHAMLHGLPTGRVTGMDKQQINWDNVQSVIDLCERYNEIQAARLKLKKLKECDCAAPLDGYCHADCVGGKFLDKSEGIAVCSKHHAMLYDLPTGKITGMDQQQVNWDNVQSVIDLCQQFNEIQAAKLKLKTLEDSKCAAFSSGYCHADCKNGKFLDKSEGIAVCSKHHAMLSRLPNGEVGGMDQQQVNWDDVQSVIDLCQQFNEIQAAKLKLKTLEDNKCAAFSSGYCHADCKNGKFLDKSEGIAVCSKHKTMLYKVHTGKITGMDQQQVNWDDVQSVIDLCQQYNKKKPKK